MPFVFLVFRNYTIGRIARSFKIEGLKGIMGCPKQEGVSLVKGNGSPAEGENKRGESSLSGCSSPSSLFWSPSSFFRLFFLSPRISPAVTPLPTDSERC